MSAIYDKGTDLWFHHGDIIRAGRVAMIKLVCQVSRVRSVIRVRSVSRVRSGTGLASSVRAPAPLDPVPSPRPRIASA